LLCDGAATPVFKPGDAVVCCGDYATHFFVVKEGRYRVTTLDGGAVCHMTLGPGSSFGEGQLVHGGRHWATVVAEVNGRCWAVDRRAFRTAMMVSAERNLKETKNSLENVRMFHYIDPQQREQVYKDVVVQVYDSGHRVLQQGAAARSNCIFIVKSGSLAVEIDGRQVSTLEPGDNFGELAYLYGEPRSATILALEPSQIYAVNVDKLRQVLGKSFAHVMWLNVVVLALRRFFKVHDVGLDTSTLADQFIIRDLPPKTKVDDSDVGGLRFVVVLSGAVSVRGRPDGEGRQLHRGECFGEEYLRNAALPFRHIIENDTEQPCKLACLSSEALMAISSTTSDTLSLRRKVELVRKVYVFRHISNHHCQLIAKSFRTVMRSQGDNVIQEGELGSEFYVITFGELVVTLKGRTIRTLGVSDYFGERGLLYDEPRTATVTCASKNAKLMVIGKAVFMEIIEEKMLHHLEERIQLQRSDIELKDLQVVRTIGRGSFGVVKLVEHQTTHNRYALKCIRRAEAVKKNQQENLRQEREILLENDHPFIVKVVRTFKDRQCVYILTEVLLGGELYDVIRMIGALSKTQCLFYIGCLLLALESLHERRIVYRDLKPENVLLDSQGYVKLIDFGCAIKTRTDCSSTVSIVGTPHYMAPEVITGQGYGFTCDVWSLGVLSYEFLCGPLPFGHTSDDMMDIFRDILVCPLHFPSFVQDQVAIHFIKKLLCRVVERRLGCGTSRWQAVKNHPYFNEFSFDDLLSRKLLPPLVPEVLSPAAKSDRSAKAGDYSLDTASSSGLSDSSDEECRKDVWDKDF